MEVARAFTAELEGVDVAFLLTGDSVDELLKVVDLRSLSASVSPPQTHQPP